MSMFSEIATETTIKKIVVKIKNELKVNENPSVRATLKELGRFALRELEGDMPKWAKKYERLFKE